MSDERQLKAGLDEHHGEIMAIHAVLAALLRTLPPDALQAFTAAWRIESEHAQTHLLNSTTADTTVAAFDRAQRLLEAMLPNSPK